MALKIEGFLLKRSTTLFLFVVITCLSCVQDTNEHFTRATILLDKNWKFSQDANDQVFTVNYDDSNWQTVSVPHDWAISGPFDKEIDKQTIAIVQNGENVPTEKTGRTGALPHIGEGWYRTSFTVPQFEKGKKAIILFEGAMSEPEVFLNGKKIGEWAYGYSYFYFDISDDLLVDKQNVLAVKLSNKEFSSRWYPGAGLYRKVSVIVTNPISFEQWGTFITTPSISKDVATVTIKAKINGDNAVMLTKILDADTY